MTSEFASNSISIDVLISGRDESSTGGFVKFSVILLATVTVVSAATQQSNAGAAPAQPVDMHNSRISLDWAGTYEGVLPCAGCPGTKTRLTLNQDGSYRLATKEQGSENSERFVSGAFRWQPSGNAITLDERGGRKQFSVGEGRLTLLLAEGGTSQPSAANLVLTLAQSAPQNGDLREQLGRYRWNLASATGPDGRRIVGLPPGRSRPVLFTFGGTQISIQGPCNRLTGRFTISADNQMTVTAGASTRMGCRPLLMRADAALTNILAKPLQVQMTTRPGAQLHLVSPGNGSLSFRGEPTRESIYGPSTTVFLEIAARSVDCPNPIPPATRCVQYRERHYDEKGLLVGTPGEWKPLTVEIEGYTHREGVRNVLRVHRFQGPASAGGTPSVHYVLDMVVESEHVIP
jgi:heat shock protein HslJ